MCDYSIYLTAVALLISLGAYLYSHRKLKDSMFIAYLKDNGVYDQYVTNVKAHHNIKTDKLLNEFMKKLGDYRYPLKHGFLIGDSPEGYEFWDKIDDKYSGYYNIMARDV